MSKKIKRVTMTTKLQVRKFYHREEESKRKLIPTKIGSSSGKILCMSWINCNNCKHTFTAGFFENWLKWATCTFWTRQNFSPKLRAVASHFVKWICKHFKIPFLWNLVTKERRWVGKGREIRRMETLFHQIGWIERDLCPGIFSIDIFFPLLG